MKIGPLEVKLADREPVGRPSPRRGEIGATGSQIFSGILTEDEYNPDLLGNLRYDKYDQMRKGDGQVRAGLMAVKLPLLRAEWTVKPASKSDEDKSIANFIQEDLFETMTIPWQRFLRQALLMLDYGSMPFEKVWTLREGKIHLHKLAPRLPKSVLQWLVDETGGLRGIKQLVIRSSETTQVDIPVEKLLLFVNEQEGSDFRGTSLLRAAYKHWYYKDRFYKVDAIAKEKRGIGVDVGKLYGPVDEERRKDMEAALMTMHSHEKMFFTEIEGEHEYRVEGVQGRLVEILQSVEHHDVRILRSILAEFLSMGERSVGSQAMHRDKTAFFMMALAAVADDLLDVINQNLIRPWVDYNWKVEKYPKLVHSRLETRDAQVIASAVARLVNVGALTADNETENRLRQILELPEIAEDAERPVPLPKGTPNTPPPGQPPGQNGQTAAVAKARGAQLKQVERLVRVGYDIAEKGQWGRIEDVNIPYKTEVADAIQLSLSEAGLGLVDGEALKILTIGYHKRLKQAFVEEMEAQQDGDGFNEEGLRAALVRALG